MTGAESNGISYWEAAIRAANGLRVIRMAGGFGYSPNVSNTGAWSCYAAAGWGSLCRIIASAQRRRINLRRCRLFLVRQSVSGTRGFSVPRLSYLERGRYVHPFSTSTCATTTLISPRKIALSSPAIPARNGRSAINPVTNPQGLVSNWCSATFVAKFWFALK